jgi:hypothetical protein
MTDNQILLPEPTSAATQLTAIIPSTLSMQARRWYQGVGMSNWV